MTNYHVVEMALEPSTSYDLALLRVADGGSLPPVEPFTIGESGDLDVGQKTIAIGNPFGGPRAAPGFASARRPEADTRAPARSAASAPPARHPPHG